ncbi:flagella basal body P-ring formation protein FlgA [Vibrio albus]|uniref:Flagella basal body P-ring formation protein FlgA n=1 Tax=Vibrio albus TaxID=2200953 RepID=A0A2U3B865_9VIBR|nr:flagellar basal body P-ring formation chaperone FlgA [Vibrio albus]PWI33000.1 flagella basal body P-ring formation protein FlgA [Vibrio albus]
MSYNTGRKGNFRTSEAERKDRKFILHLLISALLFLMGSSAAKAESARKNELEMHLNQSVRQEIATYAALHDWTRYTPQITLRIPSSVEHLPACPQPLRITSRDYNQQPIGNLKRQVSCNAPEQQWQLSIRVTVSITLPVAVAKTTINRETKISSEMLKMESMTFRQPKDFVTRFQSLLGKRAKRRIRSGQIVSPSYLEQNWLIEKGDEVIITASKNGMQASTKGIAMENGARNEQISVKNASSGTIIRATVTERGKVETNF